MMYKNYSQDTTYYGEKYRIDVPIIILNRTPEGKPEPIEPIPFDDE